MRKVIEASFLRPRTVLLALIVILFLGAQAYQSIPKESSPDIPIPIYYISISHEGISPEDAERLLIKPMEQELRSLEGLKEIRTTASLGQVSIVVEFEPGANADLLEQDVRQKVDAAKAKLPADADEPSVNEVNVALFPVLLVTLYGDVPERTLVNLANELQDQLEGLPGVLEVGVGGDRNEVIEVRVSPEKMQAFKINIGEVYQLISRNNQMVAAGSLDMGAARFQVKVPGVVSSTTDFLNMPIKSVQGRTILVKDVATVHRTFKDVEKFARLDGKPALVLEIKKRIGANIISTIDDVKAKIDLAKQQVPGVINVHYSQDASKEIKTMLGDLQNNVISGIVLVMIVVVGILGVRAGLLVGVSIPGSFLLGMLAIQMMGLTVNIVVLFSLILALGLLVDATIVVVELADRNCQEGMEPRAAYREAATRMAWPIIASTATTLAAFAPLLFWPDVIGEFMSYMPITLIAVLSASLLMAMIFIPNLGAVIMARQAKRKKVREDGYSWGTLVYRGLLKRLIVHPILVMLAVVGMMFVVMTSYQKAQLGSEFFPEIDPENAMVIVQARGNLSPRRKDRLVRIVEQKILPMKDFKSVYVQSGNVSGDALPGDTIGTLQLELHDWTARRPWAEVSMDIRHRLKDISGVEVQVRKAESGPVQGKPIKVQLSGLSLENLQKVSDLIMQKMATIPGVVDIEDSRPKPSIEWLLTVDRAKAAEYGVDIATIGQAIKMVTRGIKVSDYLPVNSRKELDVMVRFPVAQRNLAELDKLRIETDKGAVPIGRFVTREAKPGVATLNRTDEKRVLTIEAGLEEGVLAETAFKALQAWYETAVKEESLLHDPALGVRLKGEQEEMQSSMAFLGGAFLIALAMIAAILVTQFNSFYQAFLILSSIIFSTIGVFLALLVTHQPFGVVMSGIGVIALAGIVVNNNIVLIDTYNVLRKEGKQAFDAIVETGTQRLRPVLMTTATTVLGLLPMVFKMNVDIMERSITFGAPSTQWWAQLATAIVGGLLFATLLTLFVTPSLLMLGAKTDAAFKAMKRRLTGNKHDPLVVS